MDVALVLDHLGFSKLCFAILEAPIDGTTLGMCGDEDLAALGVTLAAQRKRLLKEIGLMKDHGVPVPTKQVFSTQQRVRSLIESSGDRCRSIAQYISGRVSGTPLPRTHARARK